MRRFLVLLYFSLTPLLAQAWNAAGHRLTATIAWQEITPPTQQFIGNLLTEHPDYPSWLEKTHTSDMGAIFAEAATWPDSIRNDPRFYDAEHSSPTPTIPGLFDNARHKSWHYVDIAASSTAEKGELDRQIKRLSTVLRYATHREELVYALPWLIHLVADIHQPLHVGVPSDEGGNLVEIENLGSSSPAFSNLHQYWDNLPGPRTLRGKHLAQTAAALLANHTAEEYGSIDQWRDESHRLLPVAYPERIGKQPARITETFDRQARDIAEQRLVNAGYRLGHLLENSLMYRVSRETR